MVIEYFYYELPKFIADSKYDGVQYWYSYRAVSSLSRKDYDVLKLTHNSTRVWCETDNLVRYIKNREHGILKTVDMREFFLVKLRSKPHILKEL